MIWSILAGPLGILLASLGPTSYLYRRLLYKLAHLGYNPGGHIIIYQNLPCLLKNGKAYGPLGDFKCPTEKFAAEMEEEYGWGGEGVGLHWTHSRHDSWGPAHFSYAAYKKAAYDPKAVRNNDVVIFFNSSWVRNGDFGSVSKAFPVVINLETASPERIARRHLMADAFPALGPEPLALPEFVVPPGISSRDYGTALLSKVTDLIMLNMFRQMFGGEVNWDLAEIKNASTAINKALAIDEAPLPLPAPPLPTFLNFLKTPERRAKAAITLGEDLKRATKTLEKTWFPCAAAKRFFELAMKRGRTQEDAEARLWEVFGTMAVAGFGGTPFLTHDVVAHLASDPRRLVPIFRKNPRKFVLEVARLHPPVAGMNPSIVHAPKTWKMGNGETYVEKTGEFFTMWTWSANRDPNVFGGPQKDPAVANAYDYNRDNVEQLLTWNNAYADVLKCDNAAGCDHAPRPCPGIHIALRITIEVAEFFAKGMEENLKEKGVEEL